MFEERPVGNYNSHQRDDDGDSQGGFEDEEEIDLNAVSNAELEAKIRKMKEKLRMVQPSEEGGDSQQESDRDQEDQS